MGGWNLENVTTNFAVAPENATTAHVDGEGHFHLYVNGIKIVRFYATWLYLPPLMPGSHDITVELSANSHAPLAHDGERIAATVRIDQPAVAPHMHPMGEEAVSDPGAPTISLTATEDPAGGYNLHATLQNFTISAANAGGAHAANKGHLHLYVNDVKAARVYGGWHYLPKLGPGLHKIRMALYTSDHRPYVKDGAPIADEVEVLVTGPGVPAGAGHTHP